MASREHPEHGRRLSVSPGRSTWILTALYCTFLLAMAGYFVFGMVSVLDENGGGPFAVIWGMIVLLIVVAAVHSVVKAYNGAHWLNGTVLTARRVRGIVRCDLSRSSVALHRGASGLGSPKLLITSPGTRTITMPLLPYGTARVLTPDELHALAEAILAYGDAPPRPESQQADAEAVASELRRLAADHPSAPSAT